MMAGYDPIDATFERVSPAAFAETTGVPLGWAVISHRLMPDRSSRRTAHGKWYKFQSEHAHVFRVLRFSTRLRTGTGRSKVENADLVIDWVGWLELCNHQDNVKIPVKLRITPASKFMLPFIILKHPDPTHRLAGGLAWLSVILTLFGTFVSFVG
jgi:hypothetical protein